jgi:hypothetical protein
MTTRLVVVMRDAGNLGSQDAQTCRVPAHVRGVTASYSPPPRVGRCAGATSMPAIFGPAVARARLRKQFRSHDLRDTWAALRIANGRHMEEMKDHLGHPSTRGHVRSVRAPVPAGSSGTRRRAR